jgi:conjugative relaxase-like TrwC/TraI family protein
LFMLSPQTQYRLANAKEYFEEHLCAGDYYSEGQSIAGQWFGKGAESLQITGTVDRDEFLHLCDNLDPRTGNRLTQRLKTTRSVAGDAGEVHEVANRRVFYDFTFSPPKSVSIAALVGRDSRIVEAHNRAVAAALVELERFAGTRVRVEGSFSDRTTANIVCAVFRHDTSRALDPHLHSHCILFNATFDPTENRWKALQNYEMLRARKYVENVYYHALARELGEFGYELDNHPRGDFEIKGVSQELCRRFSKRHQEIDEKTQALLAEKPHLRDGNVKDIREGIAQSERSRKIKGIRLEELRCHWDSQVSPTEKQTIGALKTGSPKRDQQIGSDALGAVAWAEEHLFDRRSVVLEHELWRHALEHARGQNIAVEELQQATRDRGYIRNERKPHNVTTKGALEREWEIVCLAKAGIGRFRPLAPCPTLRDSRLDSDQRVAVEQILNSRDFVTLFRGGAGTGKSYALREVRRGLETAGHPIQVIAPQRQQAIGLERDGFRHVQTVSEFLTKQQMPLRAVVIVDEAGQIGAQQMQQLLRYVRGNSGRVILSGDTRQHGAVQASDALRAIEKYSGLRAAELKEIRRQDPARGRTRAERQQIEQYREAVKEASAGNLVGSFDRLDKQDAIVACSLIDQQDRLAEQYINLAVNRRSVVVVSQTWSEIHKVNDRVRVAMKSRQLLGADDRTVTALEPVDLTDAQKRDQRSYANERVLVFNRPAAGFTRGEVGHLRTITQSGVVVESADKVRTVPFRQLSRFTVCQMRQLPLTGGDRLQLKANGRTRQKQRLVNGELVTVQKVRADGRIKLQDGRVLEKDYRQFVRGFAITSYASQGKTVDYVLFSDSAVKAATNQQQWYVTISRGRKGIRIFTSDKVQLRENICRSGDRELAMDMAGGPLTEQRGISPRLGQNGRYAPAIAAGLRQGMDATISAVKTRGIGQSRPV